MERIGFDPPDQIKEGGRVTLTAHVPQNTERIHWRVEAGGIAEPTQESPPEIVTGEDFYVFRTTWDTTGLPPGTYTIRYLIEGGGRDKETFEGQYKVVSRSRARAIARATGAWLTPLRIAAIVALAFGIAAAWWFIAAAGGNGELKIGNAFAGLGYLSGALLVATLVLALGWLASAWRSREPGPPRRRGPRRGGGDDRGIVRAQLAWGAGLVIVGAIVGLICLCFVHPGDTAQGPVLALATATIGAGATLLPAGAASAASARMTQAGNGTALDPVVVTTVVTHEDFKGTVVPNRTASTAYFEYQDAPVTGKPDAAIAKTGPNENVAADVAVREVAFKPTALDSAKDYRVRLVAETAAGKRIEGNWLELPKQRTIN
jgi:hypothetical protein